MGPENNVVDITNVAESMRGTFVTWAINYLYAQAVVTPGFTWLSLPIISSVFRSGLTYLLNILTVSAVMDAFFINTSIRKASQAQDYVDALTLKNGLPTTVSDAEYEKAEQAEIAAFNSFVVLGN
jgi:hypothetical protein